MPCLLLEFFMHLWLPTKIALAHYIDTLMQAGKGMSELVRLGVVPWRHMPRRALMLQVQVTNELSRSEKSLQ